MNIRVVVPRRADAGHRDRIWTYCRAYWKRELGWDMVEGTHYDGPWNRPKAVHQATEGDWDVVVILDADVIVDAERIREGVQLAAETGEMVLPYERRWFVDAAGTRMVLDGGYDGDWAKIARADKYLGFCSSANIIPRALWDEIGGMDERFAGWGGDDDALNAACLALAGVRRLPGILWHLHHQIDPTRQEALDADRLRRPCAGYRQTSLLAARYRSTTTREAMRALLDEPRTPDQVVAVCLTNGVRDTLAKTLDSFDRMVTGPIGRRLIVGDNCTPQHDGWETVTVKGGNYIRAVRAAYDHAIGSGQPWIWFLEDDFVYETPIDITAMQAAMDAEPRLAQMALLRQAWYPDELAAGGIIGAHQANGGTFLQRRSPAGNPWVAHWCYWTQNPMLTRRAFMAAHEWPKVSGSESRFGRALFRDDAVPLAGIWGSLDDPPKVTHIGDTRAGKSNGY